MADPPFDHHAHGRRESSAPRRVEPKFSRYQDRLLGGKRLPTRQQVRRLALPEQHCALHHRRPVRWKMCYGSDDVSLLDD